MICLHSASQRPVTRGASSNGRRWVNWVEDSMSATRSQQFNDLISWIVFSAVIVAAVAGRTRGCRKVNV